jgi:hypothetical protein
MQFEQQFANATDAERHRMLTDLNAQLDQQEYRSSATILDPPKLNGKRTFGRGGTRRSTAAEIAEKELRRNDKDASRTPVTTSALGTMSELPIVDLMTSTTSPQRSQGPVFLSFSSSGAIVRSSNINPLRRQGEESAQQQREDSEIIVLETWSTDGVLAEANSASENAQQTQIPTSLAGVELSSETSSSQSRRQVSRCSIYQGSLVQPRKRMKH